MSIAVPKWLDAVGLGPRNSATPVQSDGDFDKIALGHGVVYRMPLIRQF